MPNPNASYQDELFKEFSKGNSSPKGHFSKEAVFSNKTFAFEQVLFIAITAIIALVIAFSWGVERGKGVQPAGTILSTTERDQPKKMIIAEEPGPAVTETVPRARPEEKEPPRVIQQAAGGGYTVQVVTYKDRKSAERLMQELRLKGEKPILMPKGELLVVCVGEYTSSDEASKAVKTFKKQFPDCFVRKL